MNPTPANNPTIKSKKSTWIAFLPFFYLLGFFLLGFFWFWSEALVEGDRNWVKILFSSLFYLALGGFGLLTVAFYTLYRLLRDKALFLAVQRHWPLLVAILYFFIPNLPGPVDEVVVSTIMGALATYLGFKGEKENSTNRIASGKKKK